MEDGQKTLFAFYQRVRGYEGGITEEQIALAKKEGYLFDYPAYKTHEETLAGVSSLLARIDPKDVANAFLFSLSTRRLEYRSALGSYFYAKAIPEPQSELCHL